MKKFVLGLCFVALLCSPSWSQKIALTFDDLPSHGDLPTGTTRLQIANQIVAALKAQHVPPSYGFINGRADEDADTHAVFAAWRAGGQLLGNHTWSHPDINDVSAIDFSNDIEKNEPLLKDFMGEVDWHWFRYPFLHEGDTLDKREQVRDWLDEHDYKIAQVNMDFEDYLWNDPYARCMAKGNTAAITRLHDTYLTNADKFQRVFRAYSRLAYKRDVSYVLLLHFGAFDAKMLPELLALYKRRGYTFITLEEAQKDRAYQFDPNVGDPSGGTLLEQYMARRGIDFPEYTKPEKMLDALCR